MVTPSSDLAEDTSPDASNCTFAEDSESLSTPLGCSFAFSLLYVFSLLCFYICRRKMTLSIQITANADVSYK